MLIQETTQTAQWRYVPGKENPADCASRGLSAAQLVGHKLWWTGPAWLLGSSSLWPCLTPPESNEVNLEEKAGVLLHVQAQNPDTSLWELIARYSTLSKLLKVTAVCQKFIAVLKDSVETKRRRNLDPRYSSPVISQLRAPLNPSDIEEARLFWVKATQAAHFSAELKCLSAGQQLTKTNALVRLTPFVDRIGILRVGGRLNFSQLSSDNKHQAILPGNSRFTRLIIEDAHGRTLHGGTQLTLADIRRKYWILGGRVPVRSHILKCVTCARYRAVRADQLMGQLPGYRVTPVRAFLNTGVDYAGPVSLRSWKGRGHKSYKGWLAIFVCMTTSAVHLDVVSDYSTEGFIAVYRRFISRRGRCQNLYSDCGTNFIGADKELRKLFSSASAESQELAHRLLKDGTRWSFNPPGAPHFGGKWEAAVKSVKFHLNRVIGESLLTFEELSTLLSQIEAVLNSRPLEPLSEDPDDFSVLTPGHFLIGEAPIVVREPSLEQLSVGRLSRFQLI